MRWILSEIYWILHTNQNKWNIDHYNSHRETIVLNSPTIWKKCLCGANSFHKTGCWVANIWSCYCYVCVRAWLLTPYVTENNIAIKSNDLIDSKTYQKIQQKLCYNWTPQNKDKVNRWKKVNAKNTRNDNKECKYRKLNTPHFADRTAYKLYMLMLESAERKKIELTEINNWFHWAGCVWIILNFAVFFLLTPQNLHRHHNSQDWINISSKKKR